MTSVDRAFIRAYAMAQQSVGSAAGETLAWAPASLPGVGLGSAGAQADSAEPARNPLLEDVFEASYEPAKPAAVRPFRMTPAAMPESRFEPLDAQPPASAIESATAVDLFDEPLAQPTQPPAPAVRATSRVRKTSTKRNAGGKASKSTTESTAARSNAQRDLAATPPPADWLNDAWHSPEAGELALQRQVAELADMLPKFDDPVAPASRPARVPVKPFPELPIATHLSFTSGLSQREDTSLKPSTDKDNLANDRAVTFVAETLRAATLDAGTLGAATAPPGLAFDVLQNNASLGSGLRIQGDAENATASVEAERGAGIMRPLSSFVLPAATAMPRLRPALEVDRYLWPSVCDDLESRAAEGWASFSRDLLDRASLGCKLVAVAGYSRSEGRTTTICCLARQAARQGKRVAIVDGDFARPELARRLGIAAQDGWALVLSGETTLEQVLITSLADGFDLAAWTAANVPATFVGALRWAVLLDALRDNYDLVLFDAGPGSEPRTLAAMIADGRAPGLDGAYLIRDLRTDNTAGIATIAQAFNASGVEVHGVIENFAAPLAKIELRLAAEPDER